MATGSVDYATSYFKHKTRTSIRVKPTNKTLKQLKIELQANTSSVEMNLGGGNHGYLGVVLLDVDYVSVPRTQPFVAPNFPRTLMIPPTATPIQALELREVQYEIRQDFMECNNVEMALLQHIPYVKTNKLKHS